MPKREPGGSKAQGSITEINLKARSAECFGLSGLNRSNAPSHTKIITHTTVKRVSMFEVFMLMSPVEQDGPEKGICGN